MHIIPKSFVQFQEILHGHRRPGQPVQVYILSGDKKWYLQPKIVPTSPTQFSVNCYFGNENTKPGAIFKVVAVVTDKRPGSPVDQLPQGEKSRPFTVVYKK